MQPSTHKAVASILWSGGTRLQSLHLGNGGTRLQELQSKLTWLENVHSLYILSKESEVNCIPETWKAANLLPLIHLFPSVASLYSLMVMVIVHLSRLSQITLEKKPFATESCGLVCWTLLWETNHLVGKAVWYNLRLMVYTQSQRLGVRVRTTILFNATLIYTLDWRLTRVAKWPCLKTKEAVVKYACWEARALESEVWHLSIAWGQPDASSGQRWLQPTPILRTHKLQRTDSCSLSSNLHNK